MLIYMPFCEKNFVGFINVKKIYYKFKNVIKFLLLKLFVNIILISNYLIFCDIWGFIRLSESEINIYKLILYFSM